MSEANRTNSTGARRRAILAGAGAALAAAALAGTKAASAATAPPFGPNADAELIAACNEIFEQEMTTRRAVRDIVDDDERNALLADDVDRYHALLRRVYELGAPKTLEGARALARAALADAPRDIDYSIISDGFAEMAAFLLCEYVNGGDVPEGVA